MTNIIRTIAAVAAVTMLAFVPAKTSARGCGSDRESAACAAPSAPVQLDQFMKTWKPAAVSTGAKRTRSARHYHRSYSSTRVASESRRTKEAKVVSESKTEVAAKSPAAETAVPPAQAVHLAAAEPERQVETDGVAVTSYSEVNEIDQIAPKVPVVAFNDVNEIDLAAPPAPPAAAETVSQAASNSSEPADNSWIGKLLLAAAATIALVGGARLLVV